MSFIDILKAAVSVLSGGGVGVGDSLDMLDADLTMRTCRADGKLLHLDKPLTVTPLQLQRMATHCKASVPHSCIGEIWSGYTALVGGHYFSTILVHSNNGLGSSQKREFVSPHRALAVAPQSTLGCVNLDSLNPAIMALACEDAHGGRELEGKVVL